MSLSLFKSVIHLEAIGTDYIFPLDSFNYNDFTFKICPNNHFWSVEHTSESFVMIGFEIIAPFVLYDHKMLLFAAS